MLAGGGGGEDEEDDLGATPRLSEEKVRMLVLDSKQMKERNGMFNIGLTNLSPMINRQTFKHTYFRIILYVYDNVTPCV